MGQNDGKLASTEAATYVYLSDTIAEQFAHCSDKFVPGCLPTASAVRLKTVHTEHDNRELQPVARAPCHFLSQSRLEIAEIMNPGQTVDIGQPAYLFKQHGILCANPNLFTDSPEQLHAILAKFALAATGDDHHSM
jgi:hypothetical protein